MTFVAHSGALPMPTAGGALIYTQPPPSKFSSSSAAAAGSVGIGGGAAAYLPQQQQQQQQPYIPFLSYPTRSTVPFSHVAAAAQSATAYAAPSPQLCSAAAAAAVDLAAAGDSAGRRQIVPIPATTTPPPPHTTTAATAATTIPSVSKGRAPPPPPPPRTPQLQAQVRVLEREVELLRHGLAVTATATSGKGAAGAVPPTAGASGRCGTGRPELAFGRRVPPTHIADRNVNNDYNSTGPTSRTNGGSSHRHASEPRRDAGKSVQFHPDGTTVSNKTIAKSNNAPLGIQQPHSGIQPMVVPPWEHNREIQLQGDATGGTLLPVPTSSAGVGGGGRTKGSYWLSADSLYGGSGAPVRRMVAPPPPPGAAGNYVMPSQPPVTEVYLSPSASADSAAAIGRIIAAAAAVAGGGSNTDKNNHQSTAGVNDTADGHAAPPPQQQQWQPAPIVSIGTSTGASGSSGGYVGDGSHQREQEARALRDIIQQQDASLKAMALALLEMERRMNSQSGSSINNSINTDANSHRRNIHIVGTGITVTAAADVNSNQQHQQNREPYSAAKKEEEEEAAADDVNLSSQRHTAMLLLSAQAMAAEARGGREGAEAALGAATRQNQQLRRAIDTLRLENLRLTGGTTAATTATTAGDDDPVPTTATARTVATQAAAATAVAGEGSVVAALTAQVSQLRRRLKAWEGWYFSRQQQPQQQQQQQYATPPPPPPPTAPAAANGTGVDAVETTCNGASDGNGRCRCCLRAHHPPYHSAYLASANSEAPRCDNNSDGTFSGGDGLPPASYSTSAYADPLAYLEPWRRRYLPRADGHGLGSTQVDGSNKDATGADGTNHNNDDRSKTSKRGSNATATAAGAVTGSIADDGLVAFIARERARRELATAEREAAEERLRTLLQRSDERDERNRVD